MSQKTWAHFLILYFNLLDENMYALIIQLDIIIEDNGLNPANYDSQLLLDVHSG